MEYLREQPIVSLADGEMDTFIADVFTPRPAFDEIARFSDAWSTKAAEKMQEAMERKNCAVTWVQLVIDQHGLLVFLRVAKTLHLGNVKTASKVILRCLPDKQRLAAERSLRPLDEVDRDRIASWQTVASLRPAGTKRPRESDEEEEYQSLAKRAKIAESTAEPAAALLAEYYDGSSSEEEEVVAPRLMLTNGSEQPPAPNAFDPTSVWEYRVKCEGVIIVAEVGERP